MNAHAQITSIDDAMAEAVADEIETGLRTVQFDLQEPNTEAEQLIEVHRGRMARHDQRMADTRKSVKERVAQLDALKKALRAKFNAELAVIEESITSAKEKAARDIAANKRMAAASKAALDVLTAD